MIRRLYIHNFRCLENFELPISGHSSALLIGKNGSGKTTVGLALEILQKIARGTNRVGELVKPKDFFLGRTDAPMRFEIEVELDANTYTYIIAFDFLEGFKELSVLEERLWVGGTPVYTRGPLGMSQGMASFQIDRHLVAMPIHQEISTREPLSIFKRWLAQMLILRPIPSLILGDSDEETLEAKPDVSNFAAWFSALTVHYPAAYARIDEYLKQVMPDLKEIQNPKTGRDSQSLIVQFANEQGTTLSLAFEDLSDGEKCFMICALVLAANNAYGPLLCFWDEPDNHLSLDEVGHFVLALRKAFQSGGQFIATSHNSEAIDRFSRDNTLILYRKSHLEPTRVSQVSQLQISGGLVDALIRGDVEP